MSLHSLLTVRREEILRKCQGKMTALMGPPSNSVQFNLGLPHLFDELVEVLRISMGAQSSEARHRFVIDTVTAAASRQQAEESYRAGYTVSQLVHGYGCVCQGITEFAGEVGAPITSQEFSQLNLCLDVAIAQAVSEFEDLSLRSASQHETLRLGFLAHELRNYLSSAIMAHEAIRTGGVGAAGATSKVLTNSHQRMRELIDRAVVEVRLGTDAGAELSTLHLFQVLNEVESSALPDANEKSVGLVVEACPDLKVYGDRHLLASALSNLVQNAIKFTAPETTVWIRCRLEEGKAIMEVEDRCGGLPNGVQDVVFQPFTQMHDDHTGLGLGLSIAQRAIELNGGLLSAHDLPGVGCIFRITLPAIQDSIPA